MVLCSIQCPIDIHQLFYSKISWHSRRRFHVSLVGTLHSSALYKKAKHCFSHCFACRAIAHCHWPFMIAMVLPLYHFDWVYDIFKFQGMKLIDFISFRTLKYISITHGEIKLWLKEKKKLPFFKSALCHVNYHNFQSVCQKYLIFGMQKGKMYS